jgi:hypothetical protein
VDPRERGRESAPEAEVCLNATDPHGPPLWRPLLLMPADIHVSGDPSVLVRTKTPVAMNVQHDGTMIIGQSSYVVNVPGVANARCALYQGGVLYGTAYTDGAGVATILLSPQPTDPMTLTLTVTASNKIPSVAPVEVSPAQGAFLVYAGNLVDDAQGDADAQCEAGETANVFVSLRNAGVQSASGVTASLLELDPYVEVSAGGVSYGDIGAGETIQGQSGWTVTVSPSTVVRAGADSGGPGTRMRNAGSPNKVR